MRSTRAGFEDGYAAGKKEASSARVGGEVSDLHSPLGFSVRGGTLSWCHFFHWPRKAWRHDLKAKEPEVAQDFGSYVDTSSKGGLRAKVLRVQLVRLC